MGLGRHFCSTLIGSQSIQEKDTSILYDLISHDDVWLKRIALLASFAYIREGEYSHTLKLSKLVLNNSHHLIHKASGWMLREVGKRDEKILTEWLDEYTPYMPRTMLRYAIEKFPEQKRKHYLVIPRY